MQFLGPDRAARNGDLASRASDPKLLDRIRGLDELARGRGQSLAQMALAWVVRDERVTSTLISPSRPEQLTDSLQTLSKLDFSADELSRIDDLLA